MKKEHKQLLMAGVIVEVLSIIYISLSSVPDNPVSAMLFPLSILGIFFGIIIVGYVLVSMLLKRFNLSK